MLISNILVYLLQISLFYLVIPIVLLATFIKVNNPKKPFSETLLIFASFGIGPALISIIIYYCLLILPKHSSFFYLSLLLTILFCFLIFSKNYIKKAIFLIANLIKNSNRIILFIFFLILAAWQTITFIFPILGHDTYEYANQGKVFFESKQIIYRKHQFDQNSNFYYVGRHGFAYPLVVTTEKIFNDVFHTNKDWYFKSISGYYWILIILLQYYLLSRKSKFLGYLSTITLASSFGFAIMIAFFHLDTFRISLLLLSIVYCMMALEKNNRINILLFSITSGLAANVHSMGFVLSTILFLTYFLFTKETLLDRIKYSVIALIIFMLFGGIHYLLDIIWGTGWIFS